ncbi:hypothetical protein DEDE109153_10835 [Deinococcus deserti]
MPVAGLGYVSTRPLQQEREAPGMLGTSRSGYSGFGGSGQNGQTRGMTSMATTKVTTVSPEPTFTKSMKVYRPGP